MVRIVFGIFVVLHGLVHFVYFGQSGRHFELQPGMAWPDGSWAVSGMLGEQATRKLASILLVLAAVGFVAGGAAMFAELAWWRPAIVSAAVLSTVIYVLCWDGAPQKLHDKGAFGVLINVALVVAVLVFQWPSP